MFDHFTRRDLKVIQQKLGRKPKPHQTHVCMSLPGQCISPEMPISGPVYRLELTEESARIRIAEELERAVGEVMTSPRPINDQAVDCEMLDFEGAVNHRTEDSYSVSWVPGSPADDFEATVDTEDVYYSDDFQRIAGEVRQVSRFSMPLDGNTIKRVVQEILDYESIRNVMES
jgi:hypothetical protein